MENLVIWLAAVEAQSGGCRAPHSENLSSGACLVLQVGGVGVVRGQFRGFRILDQHRNPPCLPQFFSAIWAICRRESLLSGGGASRQVLWQLWSVCLLVSLILVFIYGVCEVLLAKSKPLIATLHAEISCKLPFPPNPPSPSVGWLCPMLSGRCCGLASAGCCFWGKVHDEERTNSATPRPAQMIRSATGCTTGQYHGTMMWCFFHEVHHQCVILTLVGRLIGGC